jgi:small subunit ribosomal protein S11
LGWSSAGSLGFKGPKKATPFAATSVVDALAEKMKRLELGRMSIYVRGVGGGREAAVRAFINKGFDIDLIKDVTPIPHNGPRPPKPRRV